MLKAFASPLAAAVVAWIACAGGSFAAPPSGAAAERSVKTGEWIDLLARAEGVDWKPYGIDWNANLEEPASRKGVTLKAQRGGLFPLPVLIDGDYRLDVEFTRLTHNDTVAVFFPVGEHALELMLSGFAGQMDGVDAIDGKLIEDGNPTVRKPSAIVNNKRHRVIIRVQRAGDRASFSVDLDEARDYIKWEGPLALLRQTCLWKASTTRGVWLGAFDSRTTFHSVRLQMTSGTAQRSSITDADRARDSKNGFVRLVGQPARDAKVGWYQFVVNQLPLDMTASEIDTRCPLVTETFTRCREAYYSPAPSRFHVSVPAGAKSFSVVGYNQASRSVNYKVEFDGKPAYDTGVAGIQPIKVAVPAGAKLMQLVVSEAGDPVFNRAWWCDPRFHSAELSDVSLVMLTEPSPLEFRVVAHSLPDPATYLHLTNDDPRTDLPIDWRSARPCDEFLFMHAPATVTYDVPDGMTRFTAVGYNVRGQSVSYEVWAGGERIFGSPTAGITAIDVKLPAGTTSIELRVNELGDYDSDQSFWCYPRLHRE